MRLAPQALKQCVFWSSFTLKSHNFSYKLLRATRPMFSSIISNFIKSLILESKNSSRCSDCWVVVAHVVTPLTVLRDLWINATPPLRLSHFRHRFKYFPTSAPFYCILATAADVLSVLWPSAFWLWAVLVRNSGGISFHSHKFIYRLKLKVNSYSVLSRSEIISITILSQTERAYSL